MERWNLTFLTNDLDSHGGASRLLCTLAVQFRRLGHDVAVFTMFPPSPDNQYAIALARAGVPLNAGIGSRADVDRLASCLRPLRGLLRGLAGAGKGAAGPAPEQRMARRLLRRRLETRAMRAVSARVASARSCGQPALAHVHRGGRVLACANTLGCPVVYLENSSPRRGLGVDWWWDGVAPHLAVVSMVVAGSAQAARAVTEYFGFRGSVVALPWMVDAHEVDAREQQQHQADGPERSGNGERRVIGVAGRLDAEKGVDVLLRALPLLPKSESVQLKVAGDGPCLDALRGQAAALGVDRNVLFLGMLSASGMGEFWRGIDVLVLPSRLEGTPLVVLEAMARRVPVVAADVGGVRELLGEGSAGLLTPAGDAAALAAGIDALLGDAALRERLVSEASRILHSRYAAEAAMPLWVEAYSTVLASTRPLRSGGD